MLQFPILPIRYYRIIMDSGAIAFASAVCKINGKEVPCSSIHLGAILGWLAGGVIFIFALVLFASIFWIWMIIHAATHDIEDKPMWILIILFTHFFGAVLYYFSVKRPFDKAHRT